MDYDAIRGGLEQAVPFNAHVGLQVAEVGRGVGVVRLPDRDELRNYVGSQHASGLFSVGEAASGAALLGTFADRLADVTLLPKSSTIRFNGRAKGVITARGKLGMDPDELLAKLDADGSVSFCVDVALEDGEGEVVADMTADWTVERNA